MVEQLVLPSLPADDRVAEVARVRQDRADDRAAPHARGAGMPYRTDLAGTRVSLALERRRNRSVPEALVEAGESGLDFFSSGETGHMVLARRPPCGRSASRRALGSQPVTPSDGGPWRPRPWGKSMARHCSGRAPTLFSVSNLREPLDREFHGCNLGPVGSDSGFTVAGLFAGIGGVERGLARAGGGGGTTLRVVGARQGRAGQAIPGRPTRRRRS